MDWLTRTFKPYIDEHYRTLPDREHTFIAGSSMGGLMSIYALLHYNQFFFPAQRHSPRPCGLRQTTLMQMIQAFPPVFLEAFIHGLWKP